MKNNLGIFICLLLLAIFYQWGFWDTYFIQDEWNGFGVVVAMSQKSLPSWFGLSTSLHFFPFNLLSWFFMYKIFQFNAQPYVFLAIFLHVFAAFLVYQLAYRLSNIRIVGILTALLFVVNSRARTAFLALGVFLNTLPFFIFTIAFFLFLTKLSKKAIFSIRDSIILLLIFLCSVFYREEGVILIPLLIVFLYFFNRKALNRRNFPFFLIFYGGAVIFFIYRFIIQITTSHADEISSKAFLKTYIYDVITFPWKLIIQNIVDGYYVVQLFLLNNLNSIYPYEVLPEIINTTFVEFGLFVLFVVLIGSFILVVRNFRNKRFWNCIVFLLALVFLNGIVLAAIGRVMFRIEERYLYLSGFAVLFILSFTLVEVFKLKNKNILLNLVAKLTVIVILVVIFFTSYTDIQRDIRMERMKGPAREAIVKSVTKLYPTIGKKTVFYVKCKKTCIRNSEFGLPNDIVLPFSSGPGWIFLLQYAKDNEKAYAPFFERYKGHGLVWHWPSGKFKNVPVREYLWDTGAQGYREIGDLGFGYFTDLELLKQTIKKNKLDKNIVNAMEYDESDFTIRDISSKIRAKL